jgi:uncharacterized protein
MTEPAQSHYIAFAGKRRIAQGTLAEVALAVKAHVDSDPATSPLVFDAQTSVPKELDLRGTPADVTARLVDPAQVSVPAEPVRGRPKLGVVAREVTLLPRHWDWLGSQPGGASVALRKLVEEARRADGRLGEARVARDAVYSFMAAMAGAEPDYDEAARALFAGNTAAFLELIQTWSADVRDHVARLASLAFGDAPDLPTEA